jgi:DNA polymerase-3 subunit epsilon
MPGPGFAVVDFETTGLIAENNDRIIEIAVVHLNEAGVITGSWETLLNPVRDLVLLPQPAVGCLRHRRFCGGQ